MTTTCRWRSIATTGAALAALFTTCAATPAPAAVAAPERPAATAHTAATPLDLPEPSPAAVARDELTTLTVAEPHSMDGYSRAKFPHWIRQYGKCDTREVVLARDGKDVKQDEECRAISGTWYSPYDGKTVDAASGIDIDHIDPLANAWRSGADEWTTERRREFANDLTHPQLIAVSASSNRQKGDQSPDQWRPRLAYWCTYARAWVDVKYLYRLNITEPERAALEVMLDTCQP
ncbi:HNH endonuclease family protein [Streptomyces sp. NPDC048506]|uniref:HNH endonuclease family protein n=1 Tax=Streptomyces sp. NPDC048506 TaxID=3155028 RepID=UPI003422BAD6